MNFEEEEEKRRDFVDQMGRLSEINEFAVKMKKKMERI